MFDAAAEITKAVRNKKKKINKMDKRKETYRLRLLYIYFTLEKRVICHLL